MAVGSGVGNYAITYRNGTLTVGIHADSIYVLDATASGAPSVSGNASLKIVGDLVVDSSASGAITAGGNATVSAGSVRVQGGISVGGNANVATPQGKPGSLGDPFAGLAVPTAGASLGSVNLGGNATLTISPGVYSQIKVSGNATLTMQPGVYEIAGGGVTVSGNAGVTGAGVTLYNAGSSFPAAGGNFGGISVSGNGVITLTAPSTGTYAGVAIFQARDNTRALSLSGNGMAGMKGIVYAPSAMLAIGGSGQESLPLIVDQLVLSGNASSTLAADGAASSSASVPGQLLAGDILLAVDNANGLLSPGALARVSEAVAGLNALLAPYSVTVTLLAASDAGLANVVFDTSATTPLGGSAQGVLGCETDTATVKEITLVQGWDWYTGADPSAIGSGQYDFETALVHELGHALGLGHSTIGFVGHVRVAGHRRGPAGTGRPRPQHPRQRQRTVRPACRVPAGGRDGSGRGRGTGL